jgi:hypothetical protein
MSKLDVAIPTSNASRPRFNSMKECPEVVLRRDAVPSTIG